MLSYGFLEKAIKSRHRPNPRLPRLVHDVADQVAANAAPVVCRINGFIRDLHRRSRTILIDSFPLYVVVSFSLNPAHPFATALVPSTA